jgi:hypothetical protein
MNRSILLADATDLQLWANRREAQSRLPEVVRRLVLATVDAVDYISFRAGEGVQTEGWDGLLQTKLGNAFTPAGYSGWEMGTDKKIKGKADGDYSKRSGDALGLTTNLTSFVFVTPRRWSSKTRWENDRRSEGIWKDVRVHDADDLAAWLEQAPAVHIWLSRVLGKHPAGVEDLESFWNAWSNVTRPPLSHQFMVAGRQQSVERCINWANGQPSVLALQSDTAADAISFLASCFKLASGIQGEKHLVRSIVVNDTDAWNVLSIPGRSLLLIPTMSDRSRVAAGVASGHHVLIPLGQNEPTAGDTVRLPRLGRDEVTKALGDIGVEGKDIQNAVALARTSVTALRRSMAVNAAGLTPKWAAPEHAPELLPALLAGHWNDSSAADQKVIADLAGRSYPEYRDTLVRWAHESDPPFRQVGTNWSVIAKEDTWMLLRQYLTDSDLERLEAAILEVETEADPKYELAPEDRHMASFHGKVPKHSALIHEGLADTLAIMGALGDDFPLATTFTGKEWTDRMVGRVFERTTSWQAWASLGKALPLLAQASPEAFLDAVEHDLSQPSPVLAGLFGNDADPMFSSSPHVELLWALESLAWSPQYLCSAAIALAKLVRIDPGGRLANRPLNSLREIFLPWHPCTGAKAEQRLRVLNTVRSRLPDSAWKLFCELLPERMGSASPTSKPRYRDWVPDDHYKVSNADRYQIAVEIIRWAREDAGTSGERWAKLIAALDDFPQPELEETLKTLASFDLAKLAHADRMLIWGGLRMLIARHRQFADAQWALPPEKVAELERINVRFEPDDLFDKYGWLFGNSPSLPEGNSANWEEYLKAVDERRTKAVNEMVGAKGVESLFAFAGQVERPGHIGYALGSSALPTDDIAFLSETLGASGNDRRNLGFGFLLSRIASRGIAWFDGVRAEPAWKNWTPQRRAECFNVLPFDTDTWNRLSPEGPDVERLYWSQVSIVGRGEVDPADRDHALKEFVRVGRLATATRFVTIYGSKTPLDPTLALTILEAVARGENLEDKAIWEELAYDVAALIRTAEKARGIDAARLARLEWFFFPLLRHNHQPKLLLKTMAEDPAFFVEILRLVYRAKGEEPSAVTEEQSNRAIQGHDLLQEWSTPPGIGEDGAVDSTKLKTWVKEVRSLASECRRTEVADLHIGQMLSRYPVGKDEIWPHEAVRDLLEENENEEIERGVVLGIRNSRGVHCRGIHNGGKQEREIAERYRGYSSILADVWPRTSRVMRRVAESYESEARWEDLQTELMDEMWG